MTNPRLFVFSNFNTKYLPYRQWVIPQIDWIIRLSKWGHLAVQITSPGLCLLHPLPLWKWLTSPRGWMVHLSPLPHPLIPSNTRRPGPRNYIGEVKGKYTLAHLLVISHPVKVSTSMQKSTFSCYKSPCTLIFHTPNLCCVPALSMKHPTWRSPDYANATAVEDMPESQSRSHGSSTGTVVSVRKISLHQPFSELERLTSPAFDDLPPPSLLPNDLRHTPRITLADKLKIPTSSYSRWYIFILISIDYLLQAAILVNHIPGVCLDQFLFTFEPLAWPIRPWI